MLRTIHVNHLLLSIVVIALALLSACSFSNSWCSLSALCFSSCLRTALQVVWFRANWILVGFGFLSRDSLPQLGKLSFCLGQLLVPSPSFIVLRVDIGLRFDGSVSEEVGNYRAARGPIELYRERLSNLVAVCIGYMGYGPLRKMSSGLVMRHFHESCWITFTLLNGNRTFYHVSLNLKVSSSLK